MIKIATAFSGGLAAPEFALKYEELDHEVIFACEWDKYARKQYVEFHGEPNTFYNDISDLDARKYKDEIDLFVWGSPCQDLSLAGKRKGFDGEKSSLFREGARVMSEMMPKTFIFENVKGLLSSNKGADYREVIRTFQEMGYLIAMKVLNAKEHGTAQNRERVFVVGFLNESKYHNFNFKEPEKLTKVLRDYLDDEVDEKYHLSNKSIERIIKSDRGIAPGDENTKVANCLIAQYYKIPTDGFYIKSATKQGYEVASENDSISYAHLTSTTRRGRVGKNISQTIDCECTIGVIEPQIGAIRGRNPSSPTSRKAGEPTQQMLELNENGTANCLTSVQKDNVVVDQFRIRRLTPTECFRLQGIKNEDISLVNSDTQGYKIAGNAIEVNTMRSIIKQLYKAEKPKGTLF